MWAAAEGHASVIQALVARGANVHARSNGGFTPLLFAAREGQDRRCRGADEGGRRHERLVAGATPASPERIAHSGRAGDWDRMRFCLAAANAHYELAAWLLDRGADPNAAPQG